jgi:hypothetical protein
MGGMETEDKSSTRGPGRDRERDGASTAHQEPRQATSLRFGSVAAMLTELTKAEGLMCPAFRSPPTLVGVSRSIRRRRGGQVTVAVALRGRPWAAVLADMVEGVVVANRLRGVRADRCRSRLWEGLGAAGEVSAMSGVAVVGSVADHGTVDQIAEGDRPDRGKEQNISNGEKATGFAA